MERRSGRRVAQDRAAWLRGLAMGDPVRVVLPGDKHVEHTRIAEVLPYTLEVYGRSTRFSRGTGVARGACLATGLRLEPEEVA